MLTESKKGKESPIFGKKISFENNSDRNFGKKPLLKGSVITLIHVNHLLIQVKIPKKTGSTLANFFQASIDRPGELITRRDQIIS